MTDWQAELERHTPSPQFPAQCRCGGKVGRCLMGTYARQQLEASKTALPADGGRAV